MLNRVSKRVAIYLRVSTTEPSPELPEGFRNTRNGRISRLSAMSLVPATTAVERGDEMQTTTNQRRELRVVAQALRLVCGAGL
jgi:hypothetical protein